MVLADLTYLYTALVFVHLYMALSIYFIKIYFITLTKHDSCFLADHLLHRLRYKPTYM